MCDSLGKKNFSKMGLAAIVINHELKKEAREKGPLTVEISTAIHNETIEKAMVSPLLKLKRSELEKLAADVKGPYQNWGSFSGFDSSNFKNKL